MRPLAMLTLNDDLDVEIEIDEVEDLALELGLEAALEHLEELLQEVDDIVDRDDRYEFELDALESEKAELLRREASMRRSSVGDEGAPNQRAGELTLNQLARARGWSMQRTQEAFTRGEVVAHRWAVIGGTPCPRFAADNAR